MIDGHVHCLHSEDGVETPDAMVERAIASGMSYIAFTDHYDADYRYCVRDMSHVKKLDIPTHIERISALKSRCDRIYVAVGMEFGYCREAEREYAEAAALPLDVVINSVHLIENDDCYMPCFYDKRDKKTAYTAYLKAVRDSVYADYSYDVIGHIGYIARKAPFASTVVEYADFSGLYDEILSGIIEKDKALEINSQSKNSKSDFLPWAEIFRRYRMLGGEKIAYGSDAHRLERIGEKYGLCAEFIKSLGFKGFTIYKNRQPEITAF